jgi:hypothetical protein
MKNDLPNTLELRPANSKATLKVYPNKNRNIFMSASFKVMWRTVVKTAGFYTE